MYVTNFKCIEEKDKDKLVKTTIAVLDHTTFNPIVTKSLDVIGCIIKKGIVIYDSGIMQVNVTTIPI